MKLLQSPHLAALKSLVAVGGGTADRPIGFDKGQWPDPVAIQVSLEPVAPLDLVLLPTALRPWIQDVSERMHCPPDYIAVGAITAASSVVGRQLGICSKEKDDWLVIGNLWGAVVGRPGVMKTPALQESLKPVVRLQKADAKSDDELLTRWRAEHQIKKARKKELERQVHKAVQTGGSCEHLIDDLAADASDMPPERRRRIVHDCTVEALTLILQANPNGILMFRDELVAILRSLDKEGHEAERAFLLEAWNGNAIFTSDRITRASVEIEGACLSILGGIQPGPFMDYFRSALTEGGADDGLVQRFQLMTYPDTSGWENIDRQPDDSARQQAFQAFEHLANLSSKSATLPPNTAMPYRRFDAAAQEVFNGWRAQLEKNLETRGGTPRSHCSLREVSQTGAQPGTAFRTV